MRHSGVEADPQLQGGCGREFEAGEAAGYTGVPGNGGLTSLFTGLDFIRLFMWNLRVGLNGKWKDLISVAIGEDEFEESKTGS